MAQNKLYPHDRLTRALMGNSKVIEEFFKKNLPPAPVLNTTMAIGKNGLSEDGESHPTTTS